MRTPRFPATLVLLLAVGLLSGCGGGYGEEGTAQAVSGSFVGKFNNPPIGVAVVAAKPAGEGRSRKVSLYVCNGRAVSLWLTGQTAGDQANLKSKDGQASASITLSGRTAKGTITLVGGRKLAFTAAAASGVAGLYDVTISPDGAVKGASAGAGSLSGRVGADNTVPWRGEIDVTATAGGQTVPLAGFAQRATPGAYRWIVMPNHNVYGSNSTRPGFGGVGRPRGAAQRPRPGRTTRVEAGGAGIPGYDDQRCGLLADHVNKLALDVADASVSNPGRAGQLLDEYAALYDRLEDNCLVVE